MQKNCLHVVKGMTYIVAGLVFLFSTTATSVAQERESLSSEVQTGQLAPDSAAALKKSAPLFSPQQYEALLQRKLARREEVAARYSTELLAPPGLPLEAGRPTEAKSAQTEFPPNPQNLVIGRNNKNTNANTPDLASTLAEPAAANREKRGPRNTHSSSHTCHGNDQSPWLHRASFGWSGLAPPRVAP